MDPVTAEKVAARRRLGRLHALFSCVEACLALLLVFWSSLRGYATARLAVGLLGRLLTGHLFIFLLGNAIVLALLALSCRHVGARDASGGDVYDQFLACQSRAAPSHPTSLAAEAEEVPTPLPAKDKKSRAAPSRPTSLAAEAEEVATPLPGKDKKVRRACLRRRSVKMERRRSGTVDLRRSGSDVSGVEAKPDVDAEEFRRMIESFIEMQQKRFQREESMAGVSSSFLEEQPHTYTVVTCS
ncbi:uncharacterized protein LOC122036547 [Zingiber officinale]|uniref:Uncharacterized protein n=1 Tax=Zingiber officinale TaxID=94328 RepID=A0A8J5C580_ZINOF|nr:uncharacterized protein LOC122036547 [Zingiber officinale]KAG6467350.1 hypothetical protein ZIOFF_074823 [Zingiber officinale]